MMTWSSLLLLWALLLLPIIAKGFLSITPCYRATAAGDVTVQQRNYVGVMTQLTIMMNGGFGSKNAEATRVSNKEEMKKEKRKGRKSFTDLVGSSSSSSSSSSSQTSTTTTSLRPGFDLAKAAPKKSPPPRKPAVLKKISTAPSSLMADHLETVNLAYPGIKLARSDPPILVVEKFFTTEECDRYISLAEQGAIIESKTFTDFTSDHRKSTTWFMDYKKVPELLVKAERLTGVKLCNFEEPQIVRYQIGDRFLWHYDAVPESQLRADGSDGGQRVATLLVYLNDVPSGGATAFQDLGISIKPVKGNALLFFPSKKRPNGQKGKGGYINDETTMHAGEFAVDTKWIAQIWIHELPYPPSIPPGNNHEDAIPLMEAYAA